MFKVVYSVTAVFDCVATRSGAGGGTSAQRLLSEYRAVQSGSRRKTPQPHVTPTQRSVRSIVLTQNHVFLPLIHVHINTYAIQISIYMAEKTLSCINWKRVTDLVTVGFLSDSDGFEEVKAKCAQKFDIQSEGSIVLIHGGARIDRTAFRSLGQFMSTLSPQQRAKCSLGVGVEVYIYSHCFKIIRCYLYSLGF